MRSIAKIDWILLSAVLFLCSVSLLVLYGLSNTLSDLGLNFFVRQLIFMVMGFFLMIFFAYFDYDYFRSNSTFIYFLALVILAVILLFGTTVRSTTGWIDLGFVAIQPVEIVKVLLIIFFAHFFAKKRQELGDVTTVIVSTILIGLAVMLVMMQPDLGSSLILLGIWFGMLFMSSIRKSFVGVIMGLGLVVVFISWFFLVEYQRDRLMTFMRPELDPQGSGYNVIQSMIAIGSGGFYGKGIGQGSQSQLHFLPERHTDFIFAVVTEEFGFLGATLVLLAFGVVFYRLYVIARSSSTHFGYFFVVGVMIMILIQMVINIGMNIGLMPVTGIPLPFMSYGGSSTLSMFIALGIVMSVYRRRREVMKTHMRESY